MKCYDRVFLSFVAVNFYCAMHVWWIGIAWYYSVVQCLFIHLSMCHWVMMLSYGCCCCRCYISSLSTASFDLTRAISTATDTLAAKIAGLQWCWISVDHGLCPIHCYLFSSLKCVSVASYCGQYCCRIWLTADTYTPVALLCKLQFKLRPISVCRLMIDFGCIDWCGNWLCFYYCCPLIWYIQHCTDGMGGLATQHGDEASCKLLTPFTYLAMLLGANDRYRFVVYSLFNWLYCGGSLVVTMLLYRYFLVHSIYVVLVSLVVVWNATVFYVDVFAVRGFRADSWTSTCSEFE